MIARKSFSFFLFCYAGLTSLACAQIEAVDLTSKRNDIGVSQDTNTEPPFSDFTDAGDTSESDSDKTDEQTEIDSLTDGCPDDPDKTEPGICDCGTPDMDADKDGTMDCDDECPGDPHKTEPGICDCGTPDRDTDKDGAVDCNDKCPGDPDKTEPGICDCGIPDIDSDKDGTLDCDDECPTDPDKTEAGPCGCGVEAFSCWECLKPEHCLPVAFGCEQPTCIEGVCGTKPAPQGTPCREAIDSCDNSEYCDGINSRCPADTGVQSSCVPQIPFSISSLGRTLTYTTLKLNDADTTVAYVQPEASVRLRVAGTVVDSESECGSCMTQYYVGLGDAFTLCLGNSYNSWTFDITTSFKAPKTPGIYYLQTRDSWEFNCDAHKSNLIPDSTVAIIRVE